MFTVALSFSFHFASYVFYSNSPDIKLSGLEPVTNVLPKT